MNSNKREIDRLTESVNRSGFPLQLRVEHLVSTIGKDLGWRVLYKEHAWKHRNEDEAGFIDLVLENDQKGIVLVVECKRRLDTSWIFLSGIQSAPRRHAKVWITYNTPQGIQHFDWTDTPFSPASAESEFCVLSGEDSTQRPLLERIASELILATEALAREDRAHVESERISVRVYASVIVTTAALKLCAFDTAAISLRDGTISDPAFRDAEYVRFRKQLSTFDADESDPISPVGLNFLGRDNRLQRAKQKERTVFVVAAPSLKNFLSEIEADNTGLVENLGHL